jgi:hypothetical protein
MHPLSQERTRAKERLSIGVQIAAGRFLGISLG